MICYFLTPILEKIKNKINFRYLVFILVVLGIAAAYCNEKAGRTIFYLIPYVSGYYYKKSNTKRNTNKIFIYFLCISSLLIRFLCNKLIDGTVLYDVVVSGLTHSLFAFCIFYIVKDLCVHFNLKENAIINHLDKISYYMYITHYIFMTGSIRLMGLTKSLLLNSIITLFMAYVTALLLMLVDNKVQNKIEDS